VPKQTIHSKRSFNPAQDDQNWNYLFKTHFQNLQSLNAISSIWISGFSKIGLDHSKRPLAEELTNAISQYTGYEFIQTSDNVILEQIEWYRMIANFQMPLTNFVRTPEELDYCNEPDLWHDVIGHIPFLAEQNYSDMYQLLAESYIKAYDLGREDKLKELDFVGGMLIELGLIKEDSGLKALGSTFYSSSEVFEAFKKENQIPFSMEALGAGESYDRHSFQGKYYIIESFSHLIDIISSIRNSL